MLASTFIRTLVSVLFLLTVLFIGPRAIAQPAFSGQGLLYSVRAGGQSVAVDSNGNAYALELARPPDGSSANGTYVTKLNREGTAVVYRTFIGKCSGYEIAVDRNGNAYVTGYAYKSEFSPTLSYATPGVGPAAFVVKLNSSGSQSWAVMLGGSSSYGVAIAIDPSGNAYVTGYTETDDFPTTIAAYDHTYNGQRADAFVFKLTTSGSLLYSTFLGGDGFDWGRAIAVDGSGNTYIAGGTQSTNFPTTLGAYQTTRAGSAYNDVFVTKLNSTGTALVYSTYLGGDNSDSVNGIAVDSEGDAYVAGQTGSSNFPTTAGAAQPQLKGWYDGYVTRLNATGTSLVYSTYIGGASADDIRGLAIDGYGNAYVTGITQSVDFPVTPRALQVTQPGYADAFVVKFDAAGLLEYGTYLGAEEDDWGQGIAVDGYGDVYVTGGCGIFFPISPNAPQQAILELTGKFVAKLIPRTTLVQSASASSVQSGDYAASYAIDGNLSTRWSSQFSGPQWITLDLGTTVSIDRIVLHWETAYGASYQVQVSNDNITWFTIYSNSSGDGGLDDVQNLSASGRYVRMYGTYRATQWGFSLWEFSVFGRTGVSNLPPNVTITSPTDRAVLTGIAYYNITAQAADVDGSISRVDFYLNDLLLFSDTTAPYGLVLMANPGLYTLTALAYDNSGVSSRSTVQYTIESVVERPGHCKAGRASRAGKAGVRVRSEAARARHLAVARCR